MDDPPRESGDQRAEDAAPTQCQPPRNVGVRASPQRLIWCTEINHYDPFAITATRCRCSLLTPAITPVGASSSSSWRTSGTRTLRIAAHGVHPAARQERALRSTPAHRPGRAGRQGPHHPAPRFTESHGNGADGTLANGLAPVAGIYTQFAPVTYNAGRKKHHVNLRPAL